MNRKIVGLVSVCFLGMVSCSQKSAQPSTGGLARRSSVSDVSCPGGGQIAIQIIQGQGPTIPIYVGTDAKTYRITAVGEGASIAETLHMSVLLNGDQKNPIPYDAVVGTGTTSNSALNSLDVEGQRIELSFNNVAPGYWNTLAQFCFTREQ